MADEREDRELTRKEIEALNQEKRNGKEPNHVVGDDPGEPDELGWTDRDVDDTPDLPHGEEPSDGRVGTTSDGDPVVDFRDHIDGLAADLDENTDDGVAPGDPSNGHEF